MKDDEGGEDRLEDLLKEEYTVRDRTELEGVADILFKPTKINASILIDHFERANLVVADAIENIFGLNGFGLTGNFKELSQSIGGWKVNRFVDLAAGRSGVNQAQGFGQFMSNMMERKDR